MNKQKLFKRLGRSFKNTCEEGALMSVQVPKRT